MIVVSRAKVKVYQGVRNLSLPTSGSYEVEPRGVRGVEELIVWGRKAGGVTETSITQEVRSLAFPAPTSSSHSCFCSFPSHLLTRTKQWQCWRPGRPQEPDVPGVEEEQIMDEAEEEKTQRGWSCC